MENISVTFNMKALCEIIDANLKKIINKLLNYELEIIYIHSKIR